MTGHLRKQLRTRHGSRGKGQGQNTAAHLVLGQERLKHAVPVPAAKRKVTSNLRTGNLIITEASRDT